MLITRAQTPQLVILSGKGGTGKTSISAAFIHLSESLNQEKRLTVVDADVDAANLNLILQTDSLATYEFWGSSTAEISSEKCEGCGDCVRVCRYDAIFRDPQNNTVYWVDPVACDGCAACVYTCPQNAIAMIQQLEGNWLQSKGKFGMIFHAELFPGRENSGKLASLIKQKAQEWAQHVESPLMIIDGPPGIGCPVIAACVGADMALIVAEPGMAGLHDLKRIFATLKHFKIPTVLCINKADLYPQGSLEIQQFARQENIKLIGEIPFDPHIQSAIRLGTQVTREFPQAPASQALCKIWQATLDHMLNLGLTGLKING